MNKSSEIASLAQDLSDNQDDLSWVKENRLVIIVLIYIFLDLLNNDVKLAEKILFELEEILDIDNDTNDLKICMLWALLMKLFSRDEKIRIALVEIYDIIIERYLESSEPSCITREDDSIDLKF